LESFAEVGQALQEHAPFLHEATPKRAEVAILYSPQNQVFAWAATGNEKNATDSLLGIHRALYEQSHVIDFIHPSEFSDEILEQYRVLVLPCPYYLNSDVADAVRRWVERGGTVIAEAYIAGWNAEADRHHSTIPGYGLHEVFGVRQRNALPASTGGVEPGIRLRMADNIDGLPAGLIATGTIVQETFFVEEAEVLASYENGQPAATLARYGEGKAIAIGTYLGLSYARGIDDSNGRFIAALVDHAVELSRPVVLGFDRVRIDLLSDPEGSELLILQNLEVSPVDISAEIPGESSGKTWTEIFSGTVIAEGGGRPRTIDVSLEAHEVRVYRG
jgi:hypothetical protein